MQIIANFLFEFAGCSPSWDIGNFRKQKVEEIRRSLISQDDGGCAVVQGRFIGPSRHPTEAQPQRYEANRTAGTGGGSGHWRELTAYLTPL